MKFPGVAAVAPTANTATSIVVTVPVGTASGSVTVSTANGTSNALAFTLQAGSTENPNLVRWHDAAGVTVTDNQHTVTKNSSTQDNFGDGSTKSYQVINISPDVAGEQARMTIPAATKLAPDNQYGSRIVGVCLPGAAVGPWEATRYGFYGYQAVHNGGLGATSSNTTTPQESVLVFYRDKVTLLYGGTVLAEYVETVPAQLVCYFAGGSNGFVVGNDPAFVKDAVVTGLNITNV